MKNLGKQYVFADLTEDILESVNSESLYKQLQFNQGRISKDNMGLAKDIAVGGAPSREIRQGKVAWIVSEDLKQVFFDTVQEINIAAKWHLNITSMSDIQYGVYNVGDFYDWHIDQKTGPNEGDVRKISMTCFLNEDYEGGELDIELNKPDWKGGRYESFKEKPGSIIFFHSDAWHRVRPVTSGVRRSLVAWFFGPAYV